MNRTARFDPTEAYRYELRREWGADFPPALRHLAGTLPAPDPARSMAFLMLNPSTADAFKEDPTVSRCIRFAVTWGFGALEVVNIFALRSTDPKQLYKAEDPVGPDNDRTILEVARRSGLVVAAWGAHGALRDRGREVAQLLERHGLALHCLGATKDGHPRHPLYLPAAAQPVPYPACDDR